MRISACCSLILSVLDHEIPSKNGGIPSFAIICSRICLTGMSQSGISLSAPITLMLTSPTDTKSHTLSLLIAFFHSSATACAFSLLTAEPFESGLRVTAKRISPTLSQFVFTDSKILKSIELTNGKPLSMEVPHTVPGFGLSRVAKSFPDA